MIYIYAFYYVHDFNFLKNISIKNEKKKKNVSRYTYRRTVHVYYRFE